MRKILTLLIYFCLTTYASAFPAPYLVRTLIGDPDLHFAAATHALEAPHNFHATMPGSNAHIGGGKAPTDDDYPGKQGGSTYSNSHSQGSSNSQSSSDSGGVVGFIEFIAIVFVEMIGGFLVIFVVPSMAIYWIFKLIKNMIYRRRDRKWA